MPAPNNDDLTRQEVAVLLRVSRDTISRWAEEGRLPFWTTPGGQRRFRRRDIEKIKEITPVDRCAS